MSDRNETHSRDLHNFIDSHLRELRWASYGLGALAVIIVFRKLRVSQKFVSVEQVPAQFVVHNYRLQGCVRAVTDTGLLQVEHIPILKLNWIYTLFKAPENEARLKELLPISLAGLDMSPEGVDWLRANALGQHAWFQLMDKDIYTLHCDVQIKKGYFPGRLSISKELLKRGICKVRYFESPPSGEYYSQYLVRLVAVEHHAAQRGRGLWKSSQDSWSATAMSALALHTRKWKTRLKKLITRNKPE